jgi:hypothetical protein
VLLVLKLEAFNIWNNKERYLSKLDFSPNHVQTITFYTFWINQNDVSVYSSPIWALLIANQKHNDHINWKHYTGHSRIHSEAKYSFPSTQNYWNRLLNLYVIHLKGGCELSVHKPTFPKSGPLGKETCIYQ